jgi:2-polyprenyl-3-methyl-5-hydroxy-6-metoxy-1,4-benzoquinol methylase
MYPKNNLHEHYYQRLNDDRFSSAIPDVTSKSTLLNMNYAINICEEWETCMDIGGGNGRYTSALAALFKKATLVEVDNLPEHRDLERNYTNINVVHDFIENHKTTSLIDFILLADVYEHIPDIEPFVEKISSMQNVGGVVYIMTPNPIVCGPADESGLHHTKHPHGHIKHYPTNEICDLMKNNGYELVFLRFEEGNYRQKAKRIIFTLSRRDKAWQKNIFYSLVRPLVLLLSSPLCTLLDNQTHKAEEKYADDHFSGITQDLAFKKVRS